MPVPQILRQIEDNALRATAPQPLCGTAYMYGDNLAKVS